MSELAAELESFRLQYPFDDAAARPCLCPRCVVGGFGFPLS